MENFEKLTYEQQLEIVNYKENFDGLSRSANASKNNKTYEEWQYYKQGKPEEVEINPKFRSEMIEKSKVLETKLQDEIDAKTKQNEIENKKC